MLFLGGFYSHAQTSVDTLDAFKIVSSTVISPRVITNSFRLPYLGGNGTLCLHVNNIGGISTSTADCSSGSGFTTTTIAGLTSTTFILRSTSTLGISITSPNIINIGPDQGYLGNSASSSFVILQPQSSARNLVQSADSITTALVLRKSTTTPAAALPNSVSGLEAWYKADSISQADGTAISTWTDSSSNGRDISNTGSNRPTYKTGILNSQPIVRFDGADDWLERNASFINGNDWTVIAVAKSSAGTGVIASNDTNPSRGWVFYRSTAGGNFETSGAGGTTYTASSGFDISTVRGGISIYVNGAFNNMSTRSIPVNTAFFDVGRRAYPGAETYLNGDIAEIIIYGKKLSLTERAQVEAYLASKYALSITESGNVFEGQDENGNITFAFTSTGQFSLGQEAPDAVSAITQFNPNIPAVNITANSTPIVNVLNVKTSAGNPVLVIDSGFKVGINTATPAEQVEIASGNLKVSLGSFKLGDGTVTKSSGVPFSFDSGLSSSGNLKLTQAGGGIFVKEGTNATMGAATLSAGTATVTTTAITANSRVFLTNQDGTGPIGMPYISARTAGTNFVISSTNVLDASKIAWLIVEPS